jgi:hypothetical protein
MMLFHKCRQFFRAIRWHREVRQAVSTQLELLATPSLFAMGGLTDDEEQALCAIASEAGKLPGPIVEFGTLFGLTTRLLATCAGPEQRVVTLDNFSWNPFGLPPALHEAFARKVLRTELASGRVGLTVAASADFRRGYAGPAPAMVFLDADHSYAAVRDEIAWANGLGVPFIAGHDYGNARFGVTRAVDEAFPEGVAVTGSLWCRSRSHAGTHG